MDGYSDAADQLHSLLTARPPPFIYVHDPSTPRLATSTVLSTLANVKQNNQADVAFAHINAISCFTSRLLYDTALNALAGWSPDWDEGCVNWAGPLEGTSQRFNESFDGFTHGLRAIRDENVSKGKTSSMNGKGKGKARDDSDLRLVLVIESAERLKETVPDLMAPLARLEELSRVNVTTIFVSEVHWDHIRPPYGAAPDPYYLDVPSSSKQAIINRLSSLYPSTEYYQPEDQSTGFDPYTYHPVFRALYGQFISTLYSVCSPFTTDPDDLAYIAAATWPAFVRPIIDEHRQRITQQRESYRDGEDAFPDSDTGDESNTISLALTPPSEDTRIRLIRHFTPAFTAALEALYPRQTNAVAWAKTNIPPPNLLSMPLHMLPSLVKKTNEDHDGARVLRNLPRMAKFILVASFLASTNPARTDMRMFGRGPDERAKRRRKGGSPRKMSAKASAVKIPQRLLGPIPFPLDRMIAILGILLEENDADARPQALEYRVPGEYTETEISRTAVFAQVMELASMHLLHRTSPADRLDMSPAFKCGIGYDTALLLAKDVGIKLNDLIWDPV